ncbi:hypothetical protein [Schlesneria sp.]|uniref:hypothetical protein n=1 Tax=Schlesneria sp. TaxID=2762018 RepID=UPI002EE3CBF6
MSNRSSSSKNSSKDTKAANSAVVWTVRGLVAVTAVVLLFLAWQENQVKQAFSSTNEAWQAALRSSGENTDLTKSQLKAIPAKGNPLVTSDKAGTNTVGAVDVETFTWKGRLRSYSVKVHYGLGQDPSVELIEVVEK